MRNERIRIVAEIGLSVALAAVLGLWKIQLPTWAAGGSISLSMLPIFVIAIRRGLWPGVVAGLIFGAVDYLIEPFFVHPVQVLLDYGVAFAACGLAGLGCTAVRESRTAFGYAALTVASVALGGAGRFAASFVSGIVFFGANAPEGQPVWLYSFVYNLSYLLPSVLACAVLAVLVIAALERAVPVTPSFAR